MQKTSLRLADFDYDLPPQLIAQAPLAERSASRLLTLDGEQLTDHLMRELPQLVQPDDLIVMNDTRVLHARLYGLKESGGKIEVLVERVMGEHDVLAQIRASKSPQPGSRLRLEDALDVEVVGRVGEFYHLLFPRHAMAVELLERHGRLPLPPYIERSAGDSDEARYQTVFARAHGSVAAPTAGLHFDPQLLTALEQRGCRLAYVTLHVGAGTFQPVRVDKLTEHQMHREDYFIPAATVDAIEATRRAGGRVIAIGTTTLRTLESAAMLQPEKSRLPVGSGETSLFILPGFRFRVVDLLLTNFHLPKSTLLMLVSAFAGMTPIRRAYAHAIAQGYRFFSYGDAMLLKRNAEQTPS